MIRNVKKLAPWIIIVIVIIIGVYMGMRVPKGYSGVYLTTGEIYIGKLSYFPAMTLTDAYLIQFSVNEETEQVSSNLIPIKDSIWAPSKITINKDNVIFYGRIGANSNIAQALDSVIEQ